MSEQESIKVIADTHVKHPKSFKNKYNRFLKGLIDYLRARSKATPHTADPTLFASHGLALAVSDDLTLAVSLRSFIMRDLPFEYEAGGYSVRLDEDGDLYIACPDWIAPAFQEFWDDYQAKQTIGPAPLADPPTEPPVIPPIEQELNRKDKERLEHCRRAIYAKINEGKTLMDYAESIHISYETLSDRMRKFEKMGLITRDYRKRPEK